MQRQRSPKYPFINLERAIAFTRRLPHKGWLAWERAAKAWGKEESSSRVAQVISALRQYELIEVDGHGASRRLRLTSLAHTILEGRDPFALCAAARRPRIFDEIVHAIETEPTSNAKLISLLTSGRSVPFNPRVAHDVLRLFKESARYARLDTGPNDLDEIIPDRPQVVAEEVLVMGKVRIQYRGVPDQQDFELLRDYFDAKARTANPR